MLLSQLVQAKETRGSQSLAIMSRPSSMLKASGELKFMSHQSPFNFQQGSVFSPDLT